MPSSLAGAVVWVSRSPELALVAKATLILLAGLAIARALFRVRASVRHLIIATSFAALIALPFLIAAVPAIAIEVATPPSSSAAPASSGAITTTGRQAATIVREAAQSWPALSLGESLRL